MYCGQTAGWIKMPLGTGGKFRPRPHWVTWRPSSPSPKRGNSRPQFSAHVCCGQTAEWIKMSLGREVDLGPGNTVLDGDPAPPHKRGVQHPQFWSMYCGQTAGWIRMQLGTEVDLRPGPMVLDGAELPPPRKVHSSLPLFGLCLWLSNCRPSQLLLSSCTNRVVNTWNSFPNGVMSANATNTFTTRLDKFWHNQDVTYNFGAQLQGTGSRSEFLSEE